MAIRANLGIGTELAGYRIEALLGRGATADVYLAFDPRLDRRVALKLLAPHLAEDERFRERFLYESKIAASLDHPHVVPIYPPTERTEVAGFDFRGDSDAIRAEVMRRLNAIPEYRRLFGQVFPKVKRGAPITFAIVRQGDRGVRVLAHVCERPDRPLRPRRAKRPY